MQIRKKDILLAAIGLATAITIFVAQGPYESAWSYLFAFSPILISILIIITYKGVARLRRFYQALIHAKEAYDLISATNIKSTFRVRIMNTQGDLHYERYFYVELIKDGVVISKTRKDLVSSEIEIENFPPPAVVKSSIPRNVKLHPCEVYYANTVRGGRQHRDHYWRYEIVPPLRRKGDFIEYGYSSVVPKCEPKVFTDSGALFFFHHEALPLDIRYSLMAPPGYCVEIMDSWTEDYEGRRQEIRPSEAPVVDESGQMLTWQPAYRKRTAFICRYRLISASVNWIKPPVTSIRSPDSQGP